jgi:2-keto-3-deoxy-L-rhamnonate aldolase RhmA
MNPRLQKIRSKMDSAQPVVGVFVLLSDPSISEIVGYSGCDFVWIDSEHGMLDRREIYHHVMAAQSAGACAFVRVPGLDANQIKHILDMGPDAVIFPFINDADIARAAVEACTYPADGGKRGIGPLRAIRYGVDSEPDYLKSSQDETMLIFQIETMEAAKNLEEIAAVPGYHSLFIGPADLGMSMLGADAAQKSAGIEQITRKAGVLAREHGKYLGGCAAPTKESTRAMMDMGCHWMTIAQDARILSGMLMQAVKDIHA